MNTPEKVEPDNKPSWLREENLLGAKKVIKPLTPGKETVTEKILEAKEEQIDDKNNGVKTARRLDTRMKDERKTPALRPARIPMKEIRQATSNSQDQARGVTRGCQQGLGLGNVRMFHPFESNEWEDALYSW